MRGYHVYKDVGAAVVGEKLVCRRETDEIYDVYAVSVMKSIMKDSVVVGHLPWKISPIASLFLMKGGMMLCRVFGNWRAQCLETFQF